MLTHAGKSIASLLVFATAVTACTPKNDAKYASTDSTTANTIAPNVVNVTTTEYSFTAPDSIPAGLTTFHLVNSGKELHHIQLIKFDAGKTAEDFAKALKSMKPDGPLPSWAHEVGGVNAPRPGGGEASATLPIDAGSYVMVCFIPDANGVPHIAKGMMRPLTVTPASGPAATPPTADDTLTLADYTFTLSAPLTAGTHTLRIVNTGQQPHEVELVRLAPGKSAAEMAKWVFQQYGPPPGEPLGGVPALPVGGYAFITQDFPPGNYALLCFVPDVKDGKPHAAHGMVKQITVKEAAG